jgi:hypothetical protein
MLLNEEVMALFLLSVYVYCFIIEEFEVQCRMTPLPKVVFVDRDLEIRQISARLKEKSLQAPSSLWSSLFHCTIT